MTDSTPTAPTAATTGPDWRLAVYVDPADVVALVAAHGTVHLVSRPVCDPAAPCMVHTVKATARDTFTLEPPLVSGADDAMREMYPVNLGTATCLPWRIPAETLHLLRHTRIAVAFHTASMVNAHNERSAADTRFATAKALWASALAELQRVEARALAESRATPRVPNPATPPPSTP